MSTQDAPSVMGPERPAGHRARGSAPRWLEPALWIANIVAAAAAAQFFANWLGVTDPDRGRIATLIMTIAFTGSSGILGAVIGAGAGEMLVDWLGPWPNWVVTLIVGSFAAVCGAVGSGVRAAWTEAKKQQAGLSK